MKRVVLKWFLFVSLSFSFTALMAQKDSLVFKNGDYMTGEIEKMDNGVLEFSTDYSDADFKIEWLEIQEIYALRNFLITHRDGQKYYGNLKSESNTRVIIITTSSDSIKCDISDIVFLNPYEDKFSKRISASIDLGFDLARAKNIRNLTARSNIGYMTNKWSTDLSINSLWTEQDSLDQLQRNDAELNFRFVLPRKWYLIATVNGLINTEQKIDLRLNAQLGAGLYFIKTNDLYIGTKLGLNRNIEKYSNETPDKNTWESFLGAEINLFDTGDLSLSAQATIYSGITEKKRWRSDSKIDIKYDLPFDFYIKAGVSLNYDNQPALDSYKTDYIFITGFGWEW